MVGLVALVCCKEGEGLSAGPNASMYTEAVSPPCTVSRCKLANSKKGDTPVDPLSGTLHCCFA